MSRQETSNTFSDGLIKDLNPINTPNTALTDCVNGTIITYDGNEYSLQNDRGNYALENCKLRDGYIPIGTAEYGGIIYIVSYNPIEKKTEIGSYPSTRVVDTLDRIPDIEVPTSGSFSGDYSALLNKCKLNIFSGSDPEKYKLYPGDGYKLSEKSSTQVSCDEFFVIDEDKNSHDITDEIKVSNDEFIKVSWGVPGWIAVKTHIANIDSFSIGIKSISVPTYFQSDSKITIKYRFRIIATDKLITKNSSGLSVKYRLNENTSWNTINIKNDNIYSLGNGGYAYYIDTEDLIFDANENTTISITAVPYFYDIKYDTSEQTFTYKVSGAQDIGGIDIGKEIWKYKVLDDSLLVDFDTVGLEGYKDIENLNLLYSIYSLEGNSIIEREPIEGWRIAGMDTIFKIPFNDSFVKENMYVLLFELVPSNNNEAGSIFSKSQLLIVTELLNDKYKTSTNFNNIGFEDWITEYEKYVKDTNIRLEENEIGQATPIGIESLENFEPFKSTTDSYDDWKAGQGELESFNTLLSKSSYKKVKNTKEIDIERYYNYEKSFKLSTDTKLLTGPLWNNAIQNCTADIWCNNQKITLNLNKDGTIQPKENVIISGKCSIKSIYKPETLTGDGVTVWSYTLNDLSDTSNWTDGYIKCDLTTVKKTNNSRPVGVTITSSGKSLSSEMYWGITEGTLPAVIPLANQLKTHDTLFLKSITTCSAEKTSKLYGSVLRYENIYNAPERINSYEQRNTQYAYFIALPASDSYDKMQIIQIGDGKTTEEDAKNIFIKTISKFNKLICNDDAITGGFIKLVKIDTKTDSTTEVTCDGKIELKKVKYLDYDILKQSGREGLINTIQNNFSSLAINCNLLKSLYDWSELSIINLTSTKKSFDINNSELQQKLENSLREADNLIEERNNIIDAQYLKSGDPIYSIYSPNIKVYYKKDGITMDYSTGSILDSLNDKKPKGKKAMYEVTYWNGGFQDWAKSLYAFAYCDPSISLKSDS